MRSLRRATAPPSVALLLEGDHEWNGSEEIPPGLELARIESGAEGAGVEAFRRAAEGVAADLVVRVRPGEVLLAGAIERLAETLAAEPGAVVAYPAYRLLDGDGAVAGTVVPEEADLLGILRAQHVPAGPGAMFRREAALKAARHAGSQPFAELSFWLWLAAAGQLRRLPEPLASAPVPARPLPGGIEAARERVAHLDRSLTALPLPPDSGLAVVAAARSAFVLAAAEVGTGFNCADERVCVVDRLRALPPATDPDLDAEVAALEAETADLEREIARQQVAISVLEGTVRERRRRG